MMAMHGRGDSAHDAWCAELWHNYAGKLRPASTSVLNERLEAAYLRAAGCHIKGSLGRCVIMSPLGSVTMVRARMRPTVVRQRTCDILSASAAARTIRFCDSHSTHAHTHACALFLKESLSSVALCEMSYSYESTRVRIVGSVSAEADTGLQIFQRNTE